MLCNVRARQNTKFSSCNVIWCFFPVLLIVFDGMQLIIDLHSHLEVAPSTSNIAIKSILYTVKPLFFNKKVIFFSKNLKIP